MSIHELDLSHIVFPTCEQTFFFSSYFLIIFYIFSLKTRVLILKQAKISCKSSEKNQNLGIGSYETVMSKDSMAASIACEYRNHL